MIFCSKPQKFTWRNAITLLLLLTAGSILILLLIPSGSWFGSETDWYSQHVTYADYMNALKEKGEIDDDTRSKAEAFGRTKDQ